MQKIASNTRGFTLVEILASITMLGIFSGIIVYSMAPIMTNSNKSIKYAFFGCTSVTLPVGKADISKCEFETFDPKGVQKTITNTLDVGYDRVKNILGLTPGKKYQVSGGAVIDTDVDGKIVKIISLPF